MSESGGELSEWVPRVGLLEVPAGSAALIRGLFELAAWVADHPELPLPDVVATYYPPRDRWEAKRATVDAFAAALNVRARVTAAGTHYTARRCFGPVELSCTAITAERLAEWDAMTDTKTDAVLPELDGPGPDSAGGVR